MLNQEFESNILTNTTPSQFSYYGEPISQEDIERRADDPFFEKELLKLIVPGTVEPIPEPIEPVEPIESVEPVEPDESVWEDPFAEPPAPTEPELNIDCGYFGRTVHLLTINIDSEPLQAVLSDNSTSVGTIALETNSGPYLPSSVVPVPLLNFTAMTDEEKKFYLIEEKPKLEYRTDLPDKRKIALNEEMIISEVALELSTELLKEYCIGRPKLGKMKVTTEKLFQLLVSNCIYYHDYWISVSLKNSKNYLSANKIRRNPKIETKIINYLSGSGFVELAKGDNYREAVAAGYKSELSRIKITPEAYEKYSHLKEFIEDDSVLSCSVFAKDVIKIGKDKKEFVFEDLRKYKLNAIGKKVYSDTLESVTGYNALLENTEIVNNGEIVPCEKKRVRVCFGITPDLSTKGRWASSITNIKSELRKTYLINGCKTVERDFDCAHMSILMAKNGVPLDGDFYKIDGYGKEFRKTIKSIVNITLNMPSFNGLHNNLKKLMQKYESDLLSEYESSVYGGNKLDLSNIDGIPTPYKLVDNLPIFRKFDKLVLIRAVTSKMKASPMGKELFAGKRLNPRNKKGEVNNAAGMRCMRSEAQVMERVINHFTAKGIVVIPVYDSCIVAKQYESELVAAMKKAFIDEMGFPCAGIS